MKPPSEPAQYEESKSFENLNRLEKRIDRLEDLVWKLYGDLEIRIQNVFDDHIFRFQQQNEIVTNIFNGLTSEMHQIKKEVLERRSMNEYEKMQWHDYDKGITLFQIP